LLSKNKFEDDKLIIDFKSQKIWIPLELENKNLCEMNLSNFFDKTFKNIMISLILLKKYIA